MRNMLLVAIGFVVGLPVVPVSSAAQWVNAPGDGWVDLSLFHHDTRETFDHEGNRERILADGHARTTSVFATLSVGVLRGLDIWAQVPVHHLRFDDIGSERVSSGLGDPKLFVRIGPELFGGPDHPIALRGGIKFAGGDFDVDAEIIPLGEGQRDLELMLEAGHSFYPRPAWISGWVGHRWREANTVARRRPGDEWFWYAAAGGEVRGLRLQLAGEGLRSGPWVVDGLLLETARRTMTQLTPRVGIELAGGEAHAGVRVPLAGRNLPAGATLVVGYFRAWTLW